MTGIATASVRITTPRAFKLTAPTPAEKDMQASLSDAARVLLPWDALFVSWDLANSASAAEGADKKRRGCLAGWPDCGCFWQGHVVLIELKRERHGALSPVQKALHARLLQAGFLVSVCRSVPEALNAISAAGIPLRGRVAA